MANTDSTDSLNIQPKINITVMVYTAKGVYALHIIVSVKGAAAKNLKKRSIHMDIYMQENFKKMRKQKGCTQEDIANHLGISIQAVSKWERGEGFPDITLLPKIAFYFGVSVDDLLGVGALQIEEKINGYADKSDVLLRAAKFDENLALWEEAVGTFPNDFNVLNHYVRALFQKNQSGSDPNALADKIISTGERLFNESTEAQHKYEALWLLTRLYSALGNEEKAVFYASQAPIMDITQDNLLSIALSGEKAVAHIQEALFSFVYLAFNQLGTMVDEGDFNVTANRKTQQKILDLINWLYEDGDYGFFTTRVADVYCNLAICDAREDKVDDAIKNLALSVEYTKKFYTQKGFKHTSFLVNRRVFQGGQGYPNTADNDFRTLLNRIQLREFDSCRNDPRFKKIEKTLEEHAN